MLIGSLPPELEAAVALLRPAVREHVWQRLLADSRRHTASPRTVAVRAERKFTSKATRHKRANKPAPPSPGRCQFDGPIVRRWPSSCSAKIEQFSVRECRYPGNAGNCARQHNTAHAAFCGEVRICHGKGCPLVEPPAAPSIAPDPRFPLRLDETNLWPNLPGLRFNSSILADGDGYLFYARTGWSGSKIVGGRLDANFQPVGRGVPLNLAHPDAAVGAEDVRAFRHKGRPHISFIGVVRHRKRICTHQLFARLSPDGLTVEDVFSPRDYPAGRMNADRPLWQKNFQFFDHRDELYAVYSIRPHVILKIESNTVALAYETPGLPDWHGGEPRGGAAPVRVGDEFWSYFHDRISVGGHLVYRTGLYTFDARPPFAIRRMIPVPILTADRLTNPGNYCSVVFPGGAVRVGDEWTVAHGIHDRYSELHRFSHADLESRLVPVAPPRPQATGDLLITAVLTGGEDPFGSGHKARGEPCKITDLTAAELRRYIDPFIANLTRWECSGVILHDALPDSFIAAHESPSLRFERVYPDGGKLNIDRRWFAIRDWLAANPAVGRVWMIDASDVTFRYDPFKWLDGEKIGVNVDAESYAANAWITDQIDYLPADYRECLIGRFGGTSPPNCGAWGTDRETALSICRAMCDGIDRIAQHLAEHPAPRPICCDMFSFGKVLLEQWPESYAQISRNGGLLFHGHGDP